jgi:CRISPR/Cas system-associated exonuclease Cas4 (RecB family)
MLKEIIDKFYSDRERDREQHRFYITDAGKCGRAVFFKFKNVPREKMTPEVLRMFDHGDYVQMQILNTLFSLGVVRASEINIPPQEMISGRADAIITLNNELYVVDFKSMNSMIFQKLEAAKEENINQIQLYLHFFKIPKGILLYMNKNTSQLKEFVINYDPLRCQKLLNDLAQIKAKIEGDIVPLRLPDYPDNWQCRYCQFKDICRSAGEKEIGWESFKSKIQKLEI